MPDSNKWADVIDFDAYPILEAEGRQEIVGRARKQLQSKSCISLPGFVKAGAARTMAEEATSKRGASYRRDKKHSPYKSVPGDDALPPDHPRRQEFWNRQFVVPTDTLEPDGLIRQLYRWPPFTGFVSEVLSEQALFCLDDPLISVVSTIMHDGDQHGWHFDLNDFVVSLLLQRAERGGNFQFAPYIRDDDDERYDDVSDVLEGKSDKVIEHVLEPGTLMIFCGKRSIHRVTPVEGDTSRVIALFSYDRTPGTIYSSDVWLRACGRSFIMPSPQASS